MYTCPYCKKTSELLGSFCPWCGAPVAADQNDRQQAPDNAYYNQPMYPHQPYAPQQGTPSKAMAIVSMALAAAGLFFSVFSFFYTIIFAMVDAAVGFGMSIGFGFFSIPLSLVGFILAIKARNAGNTTVFSKLGKIFGLIGLILSAFSVFIGLICVAAGTGYSDHYYYY